jgi:hypothetical protein
MTENFIVSAVVMLATDIINLDKAKKERNKIIKNYQLNMKNLKFFS